MDVSPALERLASLHAAGSITDEEFSASKARLLDASSQTPGPGPRFAFLPGVLSGLAWLRNGRVDPHRRRLRRNRSLIALGLMLAIGGIPAAYQKLFGQGPIIVSGSALPDLLLSKFRSDATYRPMRNIVCPEATSLHNGESEECRAYFEDGRNVVFRVAAFGKSDTDIRLKIDRVRPFGLSQTPSPDPTQVSPTLEPSSPSLPQALPSSGVKVRRDLVSQVGTPDECGKKVAAGLFKFLEPLIPSNGGSLSRAEQAAATFAGGKSTPLYKLILQAYTDGLGGELPADGEAPYVAANEVCGVKGPSSGVS
jgi:hypothetical protein